jgi:diacylglycerol O-acyltransferase
MSGLEAVMWRLGEVGAPARFGATMTLAVELARAAPIPALLERLDRVCGAVPRLAARPRPAALGAGPPAWEPDPEFAVERHLALAPGGWDALAERALTGEWPEGRPPWRVLVSTTDPVVVFHLNHCYTDGLGGLELVARLMDFPGSGEPGGEADRRGGQTAGRAPAAGGLNQLAGDLRFEVSHHARTLARALPWAARTLVSAVTAPQRVLGPTGEAADAAVAQLRSILGPASPVLASRSDGVAVARLDLDLAALRNAASRPGLTVNDVFLAGLLEGLARYHRKRGCPAPSLRLAFPISDRAGGDELMRNHLLAGVIRGPLGDLDSAERARLVHEMAQMARRQPWRAAVDDLGELAGRVPGVARLAGAALSGLDVLASNVAGPPGPLRLAGVAVTGLVPVGPRSGAAINATVLSHGPQAVVGLNLDPAAVPDRSVLVDCLVAAFEEALADPPGSGAVTTGGC